jgi:hypothetical protein
MSKNTSTATTPLRAASALIFLMSSVARTYGMLRSLAFKLVHHGPKLTEDKATASYCLQNMPAKVSTAQMTRAGSSGCVEIKCGHVTEPCLVVQFCRQPLAALRPRLMAHGPARFVARGPSTLSELAIFLVLCTVSFLALLVQWYALPAQLGWQTSISEIGCGVSQQFLRLITPIR